MRKVVVHGYIFAVADVRGSGASFGTRVDPTPPQESLDAYDITEWLATQPWCTGRVGMYGISYSGTDQLTAAATSPPHLKAIFPEMVMFDLYDFCYPGGICRHTFLRNWQQQVRALDLHQAQKAAPVDAPEEKAIRSAEQWPLPQVKPVAFHFCSGPSGSVKSANDGLLSSSAGGPGVDSYVVDYSTTSGSRARRRQP